MNDQPSCKLDRLLQAARASEPDTARLEFGFETRLMARLAEERGSSIFTFAWRLCPFFAALAIAAVMWSRTTTAHIEAEAAILAEADRSSDEQTLAAYFTGGLSRQ
jgi:hypothetical protein